MFRTELIARIVAVAHPDRIILFGLAAHGTARAGSDLDLPVVKRGVPSRRHLAQAIYRARSSAGREVYAA